MWSIALGIPTQLILLYKFIQIGKRFWCIRCIPPTPYTLCISLVNYQLGKLSKFRQIKDLPINLLGPSTTAITTRLTRSRGRLSNNLWRTRTSRFPSKHTMDFFELPDAKVQLLIGTTVTSGQSYKHSTIVIYDSRVVITWNLLSVRLWSSKLRS